jgi:hypothetical protein
MTMHKIYYNLILNFIFEQYDFIKNKLKLIISEYILFIDYKNEH